MVNSSVEEVKPWPRTWYNYPIILCGIVLQLVWAVSICFDSTALDITGLHSLLLARLGTNVSPHPWHVVTLVAAGLIASAFACWTGFFVRRKLYSMLCLVPQQFVLLLSTWGILNSLRLGVFGDGTVRTSAFLTADQSPVLLLTIFHTWAMVLMLIHGEDEHGQ
jgi:hypothetical protein